ncbi:DUF3265 domain-containing protein [Vibrio cholerae]|nr:DUF3265 domain-containing protein [Vibrio parahaemolyticus]EGR2312258.1 DUF3265 domain-containing protein [Vibrio cholerae]EGR3956219.1 DUF3265 domain-containing protein [Vibrio cholerae]EGR3992191.1 DUF3265 domain-containing protein [Vibrio cholerae]EGR4359535.1 DUF3265 domain-containing protein [Vibrio cholerae]
MNITNNLRGIPNAWYFCFYFNFWWLRHNALGWVVALLTP